LPIRPLVEQPTDGKRLHEVVAGPKLTYEGCKLGLRGWQIPSDLEAMVFRDSVYAQPLQRAGMVARDSSALLRVGRSRASLWALLGGDNPDMLLRAVVDRE
jgi:hypothetical protein